MTPLELALDAHDLVSSAVRPEIPGGPQTVAAVLDPPLERDPEREALVGRSGRYSYAELDRAASRAAHAFARLGVGPGDRVAVCLPNDVDIVIAFLGAMRLGAVWVGINRPLAGREKAWLLADSRARVFVGEPDVTEQVNEHAAVECVLDLAAWRDLVADQDGAAPPEVAIDPFAPAAIAYTSGTTGFPKGAVHSQHNLLVPGAMARETRAYGPEVRQGVLLPLTILNLMVLVPVLAFQDGSACVCIDRIDPEGIAEWVRGERVGHLAAVPTIYHDLLTSPDVKPADLESLLRPEMGGAECPEAFRRLYRERFGAEVTVGYGMTEAPTAVTRSDGSAVPEPGLIGRPLAHVSVRVLDEQGASVPAGEVGEICVSPATEGPLAGVWTPMLGYWDKPDATREALRGGVYHSGDLGFVAADGNLYIRGRRNELILRGGANVYPAEVERVLQEDARVRSAAVLGVPDERLGERVVAAVQLEPGAEEDGVSLAALCREALARYKVPERFAFVEELPRNAMGKVIKRELLPLFEEA